MGQRDSLAINFDGFKVTSIFSQLIYWNHKGMKKGEEIRVLGENPQEPLKMTHEVVPTFNMWLSWDWHFSVGDGHLTGKAGLVTTTQRFFPVVLCEEGDWRGPSFSSFLTVLLFSHLWAIPEDWVNWFQLTDMPLVALSECLLIPMSNQWIYMIIHVCLWPADQAAIFCMAKTVILDTMYTLFFDIGHCVQAFWSSTFVPAMLIGVVDLDVL